MFIWTLQCYNVLNIIFYLPAILFLLKEIFCKLYIYSMSENTKFLGNYQFAVLLFKLVLVYWTFAMYIVRSYSISHHWIFHSKFITFSIMEFKLVIADIWMINYSFNENTCLMHWSCIGQPNDPLSFMLAWLLLLLLLYIRLDFPSP